MSETDAKTLASRIHAGSTRLVVAITGGGSRAIADLLEVPGGSKTLLEAVVPYSPAALNEWLGATPENSCSARTARAMAMAAFLRARRLAVLDPGEGTPNGPLVGVGCTAGLVSDRPKRGAHRVHVAWQSGSTTAACSVELVKGRRSRLEEEQVAACLVLNAAAEACGLSDRLPQGTRSDESPVITKTEAPLPWQNLLVGKALAARHQDGSVSEVTSGGGLASAGGRAIFPGAFNPLHDGHRRMAELVEANLGLPVEFEISIENVDKPPLDFTEMEQRLGQFAADRTLWFTRGPTFDRKSELFPNTTFIVGADTIRRIADPRYYGGDPNAAAAATERIANRGARFLVFARVCDGRCETLSQLILPGALRQPGSEVPADHFRLDVSSTDLRKTREE